ncbi:hypothetical protein AURDEDRAFT_172183 [Auricularia subglabra TFB-10046 SS5]|nr:hypothetical protein AURDEDRAFT_172183 [Auricularia subglabra TFB-10046 SS5]
MSACLQLLHRTPRKALHVRALLLEFSTDGLTEMDLSTSGEIWYALGTLQNLVDLRIRLSDGAYPVPALDRMLATIALDRPFSLHTLELPAGLLHQSELFRTALTAHANTLRLFAMNTAAVPHIEDCAELLQPECACFAYRSDHGETMMLSIAAPSISKTATIAAYLACDPSNLDSRPVVHMLELKLPRLLDAALAASLGRWFPHAEYVSLVLPRDEAASLDPAAIATAVGPLRDPFTLRIRSQTPVPRLATRQRIRIARAVYAAGCTGLYDLGFPDETRLRFHEHPVGDGPSTWYDTDTLSDGEESPP